MCAPATLLLACTMSQMAAPARATADPVETMIQYGWHGQTKAAFRKAAAAYRHASAKSDTVRPHLIWARILLKRGELKQARPILLRALRMDRTDLKVLMALVYTYGEQQHYKDAFRYALELAEAVGESEDMGFTVGQLSVAVTDRRQLPERTISRRLQSLTLPPKTKAGLDRGRDEQTKRLAKGKQIQKDYDKKLAEWKREARSLAEKEKEHHRLAKKFGGRVAEAESQDKRGRAVSLRQKQLVEEEKEEEYAKQRKQIEKSAAEERRRVAKDVKRLRHPELKYDLTVPEP